MKRFMKLIWFLVLILSMILAQTSMAKEMDLFVQTPVVRGAGYVKDEVVVKYLDDDRPYRIVKVPEGQVEKTIKALKASKNVVFAEPNYLATAFGSLASPPNDPYFSPYQWNFKDISFGGMNAMGAWDLSDGSGVVVAVIDTGVAYENNKPFVQAPDLAQTLFVEGYDFVNNDTHPNDDEGHGTHVAGTIAQSTNNNLGVAGVAPQAKIMPVKVLNSQGSGTYTAIADGIRFAVDGGAHIINLSLGGPSDASVLYEAIQYAYAQGVVVVAAAGNDGRNGVSYPAAYDDYVISVGATAGSTGSPYLAAYSNYGLALDLVAPGGDTGVDLNQDGYGDGILQNTFGSRVSSFGYYFYQGTSMASPHVAGAAALLISDGYATTPDQVETALGMSAQKIGSQAYTLAGTTPYTWNSQYGGGLIDAKGAILYAREVYGQDPVDPPVDPPVDSPSLNVVITTSMDLGFETIEVTKGRKTSTETRVNALADLSLDLAPDANVLIDYTWSGNVNQTASLSFVGNHIIIESDSVKDGRSTETFTLSINRLVVDGVEGSLELLGTYSITN